MSRLGNIFRIARESQGLSIRGAAKELNISPTTVCDIETGKRKGGNPTAKTLIKFCNLYGITKGPVLDLLDDNLASRRI